MIEIKGEYNTAKVFTDNLEPSSEGLIKALVNKKFCEGSKIRIMPDVHAGKGCVVGMTMTIKDKICPNFVGSDIGCGVTVIKIKLPKKSKNIDFNKLDKVIRKINQPSYLSSEEVDRFAFSQWDMHLNCRDHISRERFVEWFGTIGGGNHFIEIDKDYEGNYYISVHTGTGWVGNKVAEVYKEIAWNSCKDNGDVPYELAYLTGSDLGRYVNDVLVMKNLGLTNRMCIANHIIKEMGFEYNGMCIDTVHNYFWYNTLRKGAVSANPGEDLVIPINMRDGILICKGKGNPDWNYSAPHGAGRLYSRKDAKERFTLSQYKKSMDGIYSTCISRDTIDESPMAYKPMDEIIKAIEPTAEVLYIIKPVYSFKES